jgi:hypothetical protein
MQYDMFNIELETTLDSFYKYSDFQIWSTSQTPDTKISA